MSALIWFRSDLCLTFNNAFHLACQHDARRALFFVTPKQWLSDDPRSHHLAPIKIDLINRRVNVIGEQLAACGIRLDIIHCDTYNEIPDLLFNYCQQHQINRVFANTEVELNERQRDDRCRALGEKSGQFMLILCICDTVMPPGTIRNGQGLMFKVFTPFKRAWLKKAIATPQDQLLAKTPALSKGLPATTFEPVTFNCAMTSSARWPVTDDELNQVIGHFFALKFNHYQEQRDIPGIKGTSGLSPYLSIGAVSVHQLLAIILSQYPDIFYQDKAAHFCWLNELIWREFYRHLVWDCPRLCKYQNFQEKYNQLSWHDGQEQKQQLFQHWCQGKTGYPLVDAAMRQLNTTGWMHNRLRMVVASFLTKHLRIDWRWGEQYFMRHLIDGDFASNNGGWQWAASTGCDAQPYFRIFNPISQSKKFDPQGDFIRKYLPELNQVPPKEIHFPHTWLSKQTENLYWSPIVDHATAREAALAFYKAAG